jgi:hypothetical protein
VYTIAKNTSRYTVRKKSKNKTGSGRRWKAAKGRPPPPPPRGGVAAAGMGGWVAPPPPPEGC